MRTIKTIEEDLAPIEYMIRNRLIPSLCDGRNFSDEERELLSLPVKLGRLGITNFMKISNLEYDSFKFRSRYAAR